MRILIVLLVALAAGCTEPNPRYCEADEDCEESGEVCDVAGDLGVRNRCVPGPDAGPDADGGD